MKKILPKISFESIAKLDIEVKTLGEAYDELIQIQDHDPFTPHRIQFYCIIVVSHGRYSHFVDFKFYEMEVGSVLFISKNQVHHFSKELKNAKGYCIGLNVQFVENKYFQSEKIKLNRIYNYNIESPLIRKEDIKNDTFIGIANRIHYEFHYPNTIAKKEMLQAMVHILLLKAERIKGKQSSSGIKIQWLEIFSSFKNLLIENYVKTRSAKAYASMLFISYKLLNDIVKELTNNTAKSFIDNFITLEIKRHLISSSLSIKEISSLVGFEESAHMINFFKKNTGTTPLKFRQ